MGGHGVLYWMFYPASTALASRYSRSSLLTNSSTVGASPIWPTPCPAPQISRQAFCFVLPADPKFIFVLSETGRLSGSIPAAAMDEQVIAMHAGKQVCVNNVAAAGRFDQRILVCAGRWFSVAIKRAYRQDRHRAPVPPEWNGHWQWSRKAQSVHPRMRFHCKRNGENTPSRPPPHTPE